MLAPKLAVLRKDHAVPSMVMVDANNITRAHVGLAMGALPQHGSFEKLRCLVASLGRSGSTSLHPCRAVDNACSISVDLTMCASGTAWSGPHIYQTKPNRHNGCWLCVDTV